MTKRLLKLTKKSDIASNDNKTEDGVTGSGGGSGDSGGDSVLEKLYRIGGTGLMVS
ncbi:hypothetical protein DEO72_LG1g1798 [Vigna unguiculata]|uniref:Uncharacterized protein n=1 Tax=Vigna unguiculata TaxID=3917 RepID=A0A4D6KJP2_VIGUN|nr:hypothetical protein DEO72_LG1g1798 [Vigna unguiculata]